MDSISLGQMGPAYDKHILNYFRQRLEMDQQITQEKVNGTSDLPYLIEQAKGYETGERGLFLEQAVRRNGEDKEHLADIESALKRLDDEIFGWCLGPDCVTRIPLGRLDAIPNVKYCVSCQSKNKGNHAPVAPTAAKKDYNPLGIYQAPTVRVRKTKRV